MQAEAMSFDKKRTALIFIEFQQEWIGDNGFLKHLLVKDLKPYEKAIKNASSVLKVARKQGWNIAHAGLHFKLSHFWPREQQNGAAQCYP
jgi:nicotinamidase-related amidase